MNYLNCCRPLFDEGADSATVEASAIVEAHVLSTCNSDEHTHIAVAAMLASVHDLQFCNFMNDALFQHNV
jgi:hypothetical protein